MLSDDRVDREGWTVMRSHRYNIDRLSSKTVEIYLAVNYTQCTADTTF